MIEIDYLSLYLNLREILIMIRKQPVFTRDLISDITTLERLLSKYKTDVRTVPFQRIISELRRGNGCCYESGVLELKYKDGEIPKHLSHSNIENLRLFFSIKLDINYIEFYKENDPFTKLEFNIFAYAINTNNRRSELVYSLHFDRHIGTAPSKEVHPMYHFQFGGHKLKEKEIDYGQALFFDCPRIMYHPMDFILGLDFVLSNFFPLVWECLRRETSYVNILKKYQTYFVKPFYKSIANSFDRSSPQNWDAQVIYPQLIRQ